MPHISVYVYIHPIDTVSYIVMRNIVDITIGCPYILLFVVTREIENGKPSMRSTSVLLNVDLLVLTVRCCGYQ